MSPKYLAVIMAGGEGRRLKPLTIQRAKPAVPFGGIYRIIDFTLSNCLNSGLRHMLVLTQYRSDSLNQHIAEAWDLFSGDLGEFIRVMPPQMRTGDTWYRGTADSVHQNLFAVNWTKPDHVLVLAGDHIYKMDYRRMLRSHAERKAAVIEELRDQGVLLEELQEQVGKDHDAFDLICHVVYGQPPKTRRERAENVRKRDVFTKYGEQARRVLDALLDKYADEGLPSVEDLGVLRVQPIADFGTPVELVKSFGGKDAYLKAVRDLETALYSGAA